MVIASVRNSYNQIAAHLLPWLEIVVVFMPPGDEEEEEQWRCFWEALGAEPAWAEFLAHLFIHWEDERLHFSNILESAPDALSQISACVLYTWNIRQWKKVQEPGRNKTHWDYLLQEMEWLSKDFREERQWKVALARKAVKELVSKGLIRPILTHGSQQIYTRSTNQ